MMKKKLCLIIFMFMFFIPTFVLASSKVGYKTYEGGFNVNTMVDKEMQSDMDTSLSYTVEFTYDGVQYVMEGGTVVPLEKILDSINVHGVVTSYEVSNKNLFDVVNDGGKLYIKSKKPFTSNEWLDVKIGDFNHHIIVTDAIISNRTVDNAWVFKLDDSTGTLTIQVKNGETSGGLASSKKTEDAWKSVWQKAYNDSTDIRPMVKHIVFIENDKGAKFDFNGQTAAYMFNGFTQLEDIDFSGVVQNSKVSETIKGMFQNCSKLKEIDLSWMATKENSLQNMQDLFNGCTSLEKVILNNPNFITRKSTKDSSGTATSGAAQINRMFDGCANLKYIDMSNITLYGRYNTDGSDWTKAAEVFTKDALPSIETIIMDNIKLPNYKNLNNWFDELKKLTSFSMKSNNPGDIVPDAETMKEMFKDSFTNPSGTGSVKLDVSGLGKLDKILNMDGFVEGAKGLEELIVDNLDNSNIGPTNSRHTLVGDSKISQEEARKIGAKEYGREIFGVKATSGDVALTDYKYPKLKKISAQNANVWMCKNGRGLPGSEYFIAANNNDVLYFTNKNTTFKPDGKSEVLIDSKRDYVDLIIDRDGNNNHSFDPSGELPDKNTNINILGGDLNKFENETFRPGKLAPGVYTIGDEKWNENKIRPTGSYYRISYIGEVDYTIAATGNNEIVITEVDGVHYINTVNKAKNVWDNGKDTNGNYVIDCSGDKAIKITYKEAGQDIEGRLYDVVLTVNKITFKDIANIPLDPHRGSHDGNRYIDKNIGNAGNVTSPDGTYFRTILRASKVDGVMFRNYVRVGNPAGYASGSTAENDGESNYSYKAISGGSGTDIDFTISFKPASGNSASIKDDKTFVFFVDDLDVAASQEWEYPDNSDPCYDTLTVDKAVYGVGGEAFVLGDGNQINTIKFADQTGLRVVNGNTVVTTGSDPSTSWSEFSVKADPKGSKYTWTSGIPCDSYALRNTIPPHNEIKVIKEWQDRGVENSPRPSDLNFEIKYTKDGVEKIVTIPSSATWDKSSKANEWSMIFYDQDNTFMPNGGYKAMEFTVDKYDIIQGNPAVDIVYNEDTGYFEATFINKEQMKNIEVTKEWIDTISQRHRRPEKIVLELKDSSGNTVDTYDLSSNETSHVFTVPKYDKDGNEIVYTVDEKEKNAGDLKFYEKSISGTKVTNTFNVPDDKINITVEKVWVDNNNFKNKRPEKIIIQLFGDNNLIEEYTLDTAGETSHTFMNLRKYDENGNEIVYIVDEKEKTTGDLKYYKKEIGQLTDSQSEKKIKITNTYSDIPTRVIVKYLDKESGKELIGLVTLNGNVGDSYSTELKDFDNYKFVESTNNESGKMTEEDITVIYYYEKVIADEDVTVVEEVPTSEETTPKTGDNIIVYLSLFGISGLCLMMYLLVYKKKKNKE